MMHDNPLLQPSCGSMAYLLLLAPVILVSTGLKAARADLKMKLSKWERYVEMNSPPPLPARRKRRLSLPLAEPVKVGFPGLRTLQKSHSQDSCILFTRLPPEIRALVWIEVLGKRVCCVLPNGKKLACGHDLYSERVSFNLLKTCRRIYSEAIGFLYSHNDFVLDEFCTLHHLSRTTLPHRFNSIRTVEFHWCIDEPVNLDPRATRDWMLFPSENGLKEWENLWGLLSRMKGLRSVNVYLRNELFPTVDHETQRRLYLPMKEMSPSVHINIKTQWIVERKILKELSLPINVVVGYFDLTIQGGRS